MGWPLLTTKMAIASAAAMALASLNLSSCSAADFGSKPPISVSVDTENPTWGNGIGELVIRKCDNCHARAPSKFAPGEIRDNPTRYQLGLGESEERFLQFGRISYTRTFETPDDPMPPTYGTPLNESEKAALKKYLEDRVINAVPASDRDTFLTQACEGVETNTLTFAVDVASAASTQGCTASGCHDTARSGNKNVALTTAADWRTHRAALVTVLANDDASVVRMPFGRADAYTTEGNPGRVFLRYLCSSAEIAASSN
jgi:hypothetical protein